MDATVSRQSHDDDNDNDDDDDDDATDLVMLARLNRTVLTACASRINLLRARATRRRVAVCARAVSISLAHHASSSIHSARKDAIGVKNSWLDRGVVRRWIGRSTGALEVTMDEEAFLRAYALITQDDTGEASSSTTVWVCARKRPMDDEAWVRFSNPCGRFASPSSSRLSCTGLDADSHDARCLIAKEASMELRENLRRMRDEEIDQSYARAEVEWVKRESGRGARAAKSVDVCHTYTPPERRGRGEGARVVEQLIAWARSVAQAETVVASCSFARRVLDKADA